MSKSIGQTIQKDVRAIGEASKHIAKGVVTAVDNSTRQMTQNVTNYMGETNQFIRNTDNMMNSI